MCGGGDLGAAQTATHCAVYAQLMIGGVCYGPKTFIVPLRNPKYVSRFTSMNSLVKDEFDYSSAEHSLSYRELQSVILVRKWDEMELIMGGCKPSFMLNHWALLIFSPFS